MKKAVVFLLSCLTVVLALCSCGGKAEPGKKVTLMVYMVGSDLESRTAAGTNDLEEMLAAGVDCSAVNLVVYAGGASAWHNEALSPDQHTVLSLTEEGFVCDSQQPATSMGEKECLQKFLDDTYKNYPAESYALILWDHGNGPIIGYGKDMLYGNDSLTLREMADALEGSPFGGETKLAWVGFDACLMASAELAEIWAPYADYLVASQEVEPSFGWNYTFLGDLSKKNTVDLLKDLTEGYLATCEEYYKERGYSDRDTTLSCFDLSRTADLSRAIGDFFRVAKEAVSSKYNLLASKRANTRALGRASTGSEYDLIDLGDMAGQLIDLFPAEGAALRQVLSEAMISNATNAEGCCGLSLYYPFFNKAYYEKEWQAAYEELGVFPEYLAYLKAYGETWLKDDLLDTVAKSTLPSQVSQGTYQLTLTPEQAEAYASARFIVMSREGKELYNPLFASRNVTMKDGVVTANFDGDILYTKDKFGRYFIPMSYEQDRVGDITRYRVPVWVTNDPADILNKPEGFERKTEYLTFQLAVNSRTKNIALSALTSSGSEPDATALMGGKLADADLTDYSSYVFPQQRRYYLARFENGTVRPLSQWSALSYYSHYETAIGDGLSFQFSPLVSGEYYLIFEIEDTQGNRYCSEVLSIESDGVLPAPPPPPAPVEKAWTSGDSVELGTFSGVNLTLKVKDLGYKGRKLVLSCENTNDFPVYLTTDDLVVNETVFCDDGTLAYFEWIDPGETADYPYGASFGDAQAFLQKIQSLSFTLKIRHAAKNTTLVLDQRIGITSFPELNLTLQETFGFRPEDYSQPIYGIKAEEQVLWQKDGITVTLLGLGGTLDSVKGAIRVENTGTQVQYWGAVSLMLDGIQVPLTVRNLTLYPGFEVYAGLFVSSLDLKPLEITSASSASMLFRTMEFLSLEGGGGFSEFHQAELSLSQKGAPAVLDVGSPLLFEENGVRVFLRGYELDSFGGHEWTLVVENNSGKDISLDGWDLEINGEAISNTEYVGFGVGSGKVCNGKTIVTDLSFSDLLTNIKVSDVKNLSATFCFRDLGAEELLYTGKTRISWISEGIPLK